MGQRAGCAASITRRFVGGALYRLYSRYIRAVISTVFGVYVGRYIDCIRSTLHRRHSRSCLSSKVCLTECIYHQVLESQPPHKIVKSRNNRFAHRRGSWLGQRAGCEASITRRLARRPSSIAPARTCLAHHLHFLDIYIYMNINIYLYKYICTNEYMYTCIDIHIQI